MSSLEGIKDCKTIEAVHNFVTQRGFRLIQNEFSGVIWEGFDGRIYAYNTNKEIGSGLFRGTIESLNSNQTACLFTSFWVEIDHPGAKTTFK